REDGRGRSPAASRALRRSFFFNDSGTYTVYGRVFDQDGGFTDYTTTVTVRDVAPTATLSNDGPIAAGGSATVFFAGQSDPSPAAPAARRGGRSALRPAHRA